MPEGEREGGRGGFGRGRGDRGDRGRGRGRGGRGGDKKGRDGEEWIPCTKLGRLVKDGKIGSIAEIFLYAIPIKEFEIVDYFIGKDTLKDEVMKIMPVQKQSSAGQRTRFKAFVAVGDNNGHIGLGVKCSAEVANAIRGAIISAKLNIVPVRRGYWGKNSGLPHTVPVKVTGKCGSCRVRLIPAPRGTGLVSSPVGKKILTFAGISDCYTSAKGHTRTTGNFIKAMFNSLKYTYHFLTPDLWKQNALGKGPFQEHTDFLSKKGAKRHA